MSFFPVKDKLPLLIIDCTKESGTDYFESHPTILRHSPIGTYRECDNIKFSRFAYRFRLRDIQKPHVIRIEYPDDKERTFCVMDGVSYDISTGIATGRETVISGKMRTHEILFWPRHEENHIMFITWDAKAPAATSKVSIYLLDENFLQSGHVANASGFRSMGLQWEDPGGRYLTMGAHHKNDWAERLAEYAAACGQNIVEHPITWYWGCLYKSDVDECDHLEQVLDAKGRICMNALSKGNDWITDTIKTLGVKGINFRGVFHTYRFHNLMKKTCVDNSIRNMSNEGKPQLSVWDWTRTWTRMNMPYMADSEGIHDPESVADTAYHCTDGMKEMPDNLLGEPMGKLDGFYAPIFNCLHPTVQEHLISLMEELRDRYTKFENFKGISIPLWAGSFIWYGTLRLGYDDYTFGLFERENVLNSGIACDDPDRFEKRYKWIMNSYRDIFISWRCKKIYTLINKMREILSGGRSDITLKISVCREPLLGQLYCGDMPLLYHEEIVQLYKLGGIYEILRAGGIDPQMFNHDSGPELELQFDPFRDRALEGKNGPTVYRNALRDHDFLDMKINECFAKPHNRNVFIFNCYYESGRYVIGKAPKSVCSQLARAGSGMEELYHLYLVFDHKTWTWREHEFTTCPGVPTVAENFMEYYAHALGHLDAKQITFGGLSVGTLGHEEQLKAFSDVFTKLPNDAFDSVPTNSDSVICRYFCDAGHTYCYVINMEASPMNVRLTFNSASVTLHEIGKNANAGISCTNDVSLALAPFQLRGFTMDNIVAPIALDVQLTENINNRILEAENAYNRIVTQEYDEFDWAVWLRKQLKCCISSNLHSLLRPLLQSGPAMILREHVEKKQDSKCKLQTSEKICI